MSARSQPSGFWQYNDYLIVIRFFAQAQAVEQFITRIDGRLANCQ